MQVVLGTAVHLIITLPYLHVMQVVLSTAVHLITPSDQQLQVWRARVGAGAA